MDISNEELTKSLVSLIDETLEEIEELKKSKFTASEITIEGPGEGIAGKPSNGELDAKKAEVKKDEDEGIEKKEKKDEDSDDDEDDNDEDDKDEDEDDKDVKKGVLEEKEQKEDKKKGVEKSAKKNDDLIKSYVDSRLSPIEEKLTSIVDMVNKLADQPVARKSIPAGIAPLTKNNEKAVLSKSQVADKLFELKKSGTSIDSLDMIKVELGSESDANLIANKYGL